MYGVTNRVTSRTGAKDFVKIVRRAGGEADLTVFREGLRIRANLDNRNLFRRCSPNWVRTLPEGPGWSFEVKFDGYRIEAIKNGPEVRLQSRRDSDFTKRFASVARAASKIKAAMRKYVRLQPRVVAEIGFAEWTSGDVLRHAEFVAVRDEKRPEEVTRES
jgi:ATP-dependent DNA ligase